MVLSKLSNRSRLSTLELHGVTKAITFPAKIKIEGDSVSVDTEFASSSAPALE